MKFGRMRAVAFCDVLKIMGITFGAGLAIIANANTASAATLTDSSFSFMTVTSHQGNPAAVVSTSAPCMSCGNPGTGVQAKVDYTAPSASGSILSTVGFIDNLLTYDPATMGAISSISASFDRKITSNFAFSLPLTGRLIIEQDGIDYVTAINSPGTDTGGVWHTLNLSNLTASDFLQFNFGTGIGGSAHPDFAGDQITFGIGAIIATDAGEIRSPSFDNLSVG